MSNNYGNIPMEMREFKNWCLWKYEPIEGKKHTKIPYKANGDKLSPTNPNDWMTWEQALSCAPAYDGIGFVFSSNDPYAFIDLDDTTYLKNGSLNPNHREDEARQIKIFKEFDSYSERSPSGQGLHIIIKGSIPHNRNRNFVEIYSSGHYATMTGNAWAVKPIADYNGLLNQLYEQMSKEVKENVNNINRDQIQTDEEILELAFKHNSEKFVPLSKGEWVGSYISQSEADQAYMNIISHYSDNREQVKRIYCKSKLSETHPKRKGDYYLNRTVNLAFDQKLPTIDISGFKEALETKLNGHHTIATSDNGSPAAFDAVSLGSSPNVAAMPQSSIQPPPGLMGEIARFVYNASPRPIAEVSIAAAIGLMAGICGKAYNFEDSGLNQYIMCLAKTGRGKEALSSGIDKIINAVSMQVPVAPEFVGPSEIASGQALLKYVSNKSSCFVSILGEFGLRLQAMCDPRSNSAEKTLQKTLLQLYQKSGHGQVLRASIYADKDKNTNDVLAPAFSILAEGTPQTVYEVADESMILSGLLPRFIIIEYEGDRQLLNKNRNVIPDGVLIKKIADLMSIVKTLMANRSVKYVYADKEAYILFEDYDEFTTSKINAKDAHEAITELWNRTHIKVIKLASLVAIGVDIDNPIITKDMFIWAKDIVERSIYTLSKKFESGQVGKTSNEVRQMYDLKRIMKQYVISPYERYQKLNYVSQALHSAKIIPYKFLSQRVSTLASYKDIRIRSTEFLNKILKVMLDSGIIVEINRTQMEKYDVHQRAFVITDNRMLDDIDAELI